MKKLALVVAVMLMLAAVLCVTGVWAITNGPGGGGAMTCSAINGQGGVIVGTDNGGLYYRTSSSGDWSRSGSIHGVPSNNILSVAFGRSPNVACAVGDGFISYTKLFGASPATSWTTVTAYIDTSSASINLSSDMNFTAVTFGGVPADSATVFVAMSQGARNCILYADLRASTVTFTRLARRNLPLAVPTAVTGGSGPQGTIVKLIENYNAGGNGERKLYALYGADNSGGERQEIWRNEGLLGSTDWELISGQRADPLTDGPDYPIDMAISARGGAGYPTDFVVSAGSSAGVVTSGSAWRYQAVENAWHQTSSNITGMVYFQDTGHSQYAGREWVQNPGDVGTGCGSSGTYEGLWYRPAGDNVDDWTRLTDGSSSEYGWAACRQARGALGNGIAKCLSKVFDVSGIPVGFAPYWTSMQFASLFDSTAGYWEIATTDANGGSNFNSTGLDNANAATLCLDPDGNLWAGYYDMGLWKYSSGAWHNQNGPSSDGTNGENDDLWGSAYSNGSPTTHYNYGGNVSSMAWTSSTTALVTEANSSKGNTTGPINGTTYYGYNYRLWRSTSSGDRDSWAEYGSGLPRNLGGSTGMAVFLTSLFRDPVSPNRLRVVAHIDTLGGSPSFEDRIYVSSDDGANWIQEDTSLPTHGLFVVRSYGDTCVAGGYAGLYRRIGATGAWSAVSGITNLTSAIIGGTVISNTQESVHRHRGLGVQDVYRDPVNSAIWYVVVYGEADDTPYGVFQSTNHGASYSPFSPSGRRKQRRSVMMDSCGTVFVGSGRGFSSPNADFTSAGLEEAVPPYGSGDWATLGTSGFGLDFPEAHTLLRANNKGDFYFIAPGQGVYLNTTLCGVVGGGGCDDPNGCETQRPFGASRVDAPKLPRTVFSVSEARALVQAGKLELYDAAGRRAREPRAGIYFQVERNVARAIIARRTVLVRP